MARTDDDLGLVAASRSGDAESFGELVRRYQDRLFPTLLRLTGSAEDARDLLQDAFLRAFEKLDKFHGDSSFYTWVYRIAVNLTLSDRRRRRLPVRAFLDRGDASEPSGDSALTEPSRPLEQAERDAFVQSALLALPADHRAVVVMKDLDGMRYEEIADALGIPVGTVRSRLHRARADLRERLRAIVDPELTASSRRF
jgi:RNA polymerase sigma-70 factor (ECF subfamily)